MLLYFMNCRCATITKKLSGDNKVLLHSNLASTEMCNVETLSKNESYCYFLWYRWMLAIICLLRHSEVVSSHTNALDFKIFPLSAF